MIINPFASFKSDRTKSTRRFFFHTVGLRFPVLSAILGATPGFADIRKTSNLNSPADDWLAKIKGSRRIIFDTTSAVDGFPVALPYNFMTACNATNIPDDDLSAVVVLRHLAIPIAFEDRIWARYKLGKFFGIHDAKTGVPSKANPFRQTGPEDNSMQSLMARGVIYCVCELAIKKNATMIASSMGLNSTEVLNDWMAGLLPGVYPIPAGVWAVERAQQQGCAYCFGN